MLFFSLFLLVAAGALRSEPIKLKVTAEQANIRERPDISSAILQQVPEGAVLEADYKQGEWFAVRVDKEGGGFVIGYVHESLVKVIEGETVPQVQAPPEKQKIEEKPLAERKEEPRPAPSPQKERLSLVLWLGKRYISVGDLNEGAKGLAQYYDSTLGIRGKGDVNAVHFGSFYGVDVRFPLASGFYFSIGGEYYSCRAASTVTYAEGSVEALYTTEPRVRVIPISVSLLFYPTRSVYLKAGLDYSFARCSYFYRFEKAGFWQEWEGSANSSGLGYQFGAGLERKILSSISVVAEAAYRHARISGLEGEAKYRDSATPETQEKGKLYKFDFRTAGLDTVPFVFIREKKPTEAGVMSVREAELGLNGISLRLGIRVFF